MTYLTGPEEHAYDYPTYMVQGTVTGFSHEHAELKFAFHIPKEEVARNPVVAVDAALDILKIALLQRITEASTK